MAGNKINQDPEFFLAIQDPDRIKKVRRKKHLTPIVHPSVLLLASCSPAELASPSD